MDPIIFQTGEFTSRLVFTESPATLLDGLDLTVFDTNTIKLFSPSAAHYVWQAGETNKIWKSVEELLAVCLEKGLGRDAVLGAVGGGVVTDMAAFAASLYMRGIGLVLVPTTLLAMVDAATGGKTGVDFGGFKNLVGTFYPAREVRIWPGAVASLPEREYRGGLAEVIKHGMLGDQALFSLLQNQRDAVLARDTQVTSAFIRQAVLYKVGVVERDLRESGERAFLNLGHTFAHALEAERGYDGSWSHGEAVAWGLDRALALGMRLGITEPSWYQEVHDLLKSYQFRLKAEGANPKAILAAMKNDKKKKAGTVRFVLQKCLGETLMTQVDDEHVLKILEAGV